MITYEFQILRYRPDHVSEEFVNVGLVMFEPASRALRSAVTRSISRVTCLFPNQDGRQLQRRLRHLDGMLQEATRQLEEDLQFEALNSVLEITSRYLTPDDTALFFTTVQRGIDDDLDVAFEELYARMVEHHSGDAAEPVRSDYEVWSRLFRPIFQELGITRRLERHTITTPNDQLEFSHAWKNEVWHCYEPVALNLKRADSVKNKVYKWIGKLDELRNADEPVDIKLLTALPEDNEELLAFILEKLDHKVFGNSTVSIVRPQAAVQLAQAVRQEIAAHDAEAGLDDLPF